MYRAFAPFFMAVRGDRRVTGMAFLSTTGGFSFFMAVMGDRRVAADVKTALCGTEFSREFNAVSIR
jgi:hypothetical protein